MRETNEMRQRTSRIREMALQVRDNDLVDDCNEVLDFLINKNPLDVMLTGQWKNIIHFEVHGHTHGRDYPEEGHHA